MKRIFFIFVLLAAASFWGCKKNEVIQPLTKTQKAVFNYLPEESQFVIFINLSELRKTDFWDNYFKPALFNNYPYNKWFNEFEKKTGVGLNNGISQVFISSGGNFNNVAVVIFDKNLKHIKNYFNKSDSFSKVSINKNIVYTLKEKSPLQLYFINDTTILAATKSGYIKSIITANDNPLINNKLLIGIIKNIKNKKQYWMATDRGTYAVNYMKKIIGVDENTPVNNILKSVKSVTLAVQFDKGIDIESNWNCKDSKNAYLLSTAIKGALAMDLLSGSDLLLGKILQKTDIERSNAQINFQLELKGDDIIKLKDFAKQRDLVRKL